MSPMWRDLIEDCRQTAAELCSSWRAFIVFDLLCKLICVALFAPLSAWALSALLRWSGDPAVSNYDLILFFLSWQGLLLVLVSAIGGFAVLFLELGGLALLAIGIQRGESVSVARTMRFLFRCRPRLMLLAVRQFLVLASIVAVVLAVVAATKAIFLGGGDIYFYLTVQPSEYWWALIIVSTAATVASILIITLLFRWIFSVPVLLLEETKGRAAMARSRRIVQDIGARRVAMRLAGWAAATLLLLAIAWLAHGLLSWALMALAGERIRLVIAAAGLLLAIDVLLATIVGLIAAISFASLVARMYTNVRPDLQLPISLAPIGAADDRRKPFPMVLVMFGGAATLVVMAAVLSYAVINQIRLDENIAVTAHRGSSLATPENTMSAVLRAIEDGADYSEIDVQETADGVIVLLHDTDLRRVAGVDRRTWEVSYDEMKQLDVGSWFSEEFAGERIATLKEVMEAARGKIKLNIELKLHGHERQLVAEVVRLVNGATFADECIITSLDLSAIQEVTRQDSHLRRGLIVTANLGDITELNVDVLAVNARTVTRDLVARAHRAGREVHVWTVNDPQQMLAMIHMGVDNILTSSPDVLVELLRERKEMSNAERTLLFVSDFMAGRL